MKKIQIRYTGEKSKAPTYESSAASGGDLRAHVDEPVTIKQGERSLIPTGIAIELPLGYEAQVRPRSGLAVKKGLLVLNTPGTIDADYRGEIKIILCNLGNESVTISNGDRIAQMVIAPVVQADYIFTDSLSVSDRGAGGFGSTGL